MTLAWDQVAGSEGFQSLPPEEKEQARQQYFSQVVAPHVPAEQLGNAKSQFDDYSQSTLSNDTRDDFNKGISDRQAIANNPDLSTGSKMVASLGSGVASTANMVGDTVKRIPGAQTVSDAAKGAAGYVGDKLSSSFLNPLNGLDENNKNAVKSDVSGAADQFAKDHPDYAATAKGAGQTVGGLLALEGAGRGAMGVGQAAEAATPYVTRIADALPSMGESGAGAGAPTVLGGPPRSELQRNQAHAGLTQATTNGYKVANNLGAIFTPEASNNAADKFASDIGNVDPGLHPQTIGALNLFEKKADGGLDLESIDNTRKRLGRIAYDSNANSEDKFAAKQGIKSIDGILDDVQHNPSILAGGNQDSVAALKLARASSSIEQNHDLVNEMLRQANGNPDAIQSKMKTLFDDKDQLMHFSPEEQEEIAALAHPDGWNKVLNTVGKAGFGAEGKTIPLMETAGAAGLAVSNPILAAAATVPIAAGTAANVARRRIVQNMADGLLKNIESTGQQLQKSLSDLQNFHASGGRGYSSVNRTPQLTGPAANNTPLLAGPTAVDTAGNVTNRGMSPYTPMDNSGDALKPDDRYVAPTGAPAAPAQKSLPSPVASNTPIAVNNAGAAHPMTQAENNASLDERRVVAQRERDLGKQPQSAVAHPGAPNYDPSAKVLQSISGGDDAEKQLQSLIDAGKYARGGKISDAQKEAGNYKKGHVNIHGMRISVETPKGTKREGKSHDGKEWSVVMPAHYGYIRGTTGADDEQVDCFLGPNPKSQRVYIIDQQHLHNSQFDEHKAFIGFPNQESAVDHYKAAFSDGNGKKRIQKITRMSVKEFKEWLKGDTTKPAHMVA